MALCAYCPFHADPTFLSDFLPSWDGMGGDTNVTRNPSRGLVTALSSSYCGC